MALADDIAAAVMAELGLAGDPTPKVTAATAAALELARLYIDPTPPAEGDPPPQPPDTPLTRAGFTALAVRVYKDPASPAGVLGSEGWTGAYIPEDLLTHVRHYFDPYRTDAARGLA